MSNDKPDASYRALAPHTPVDLSAASDLAIAIVSSIKNEADELALVALMLAAESVAGSISNTPWDSMRSAIDVLEKVTQDNPERVTVPTGDLPS